MQTPFPRSLKISAPAKINLTLEILYRRPDGYHQLQTVMQTLKYSDLLCITDNPEGQLDFFCNHAGLPGGEENLAFKAATLLRGCCAPGRGARLELFKKIPVAAGLGGGSSDAAAVLKGLNYLWRLHLERETLNTLAAQLGSDVPFFLCGGTALAKGRGEVIHPLPALPSLPVLLVIPPGSSLSTALVYRSLHWDKIKSGEKTAKLVRLLNEVSNRRVGQDILSPLLELMTNDLEEAAFKLIGELALLKEMLRQRGFVSLLSGSGPTLFVLERDFNKLRTLETELTARGCRVILTSFAN